MDILTTSNFSAALLPRTIHVALVPMEHLERCSWSLLRLLMYSDQRERQICETGGLPRIHRPAREHDPEGSEITLLSAVLTDEGVTLFVDETMVTALTTSGMIGYVKVAPTVWRAIQIHLGPSGAEFPGVMRVLSKYMANEGISILNMSTYDTDIFFVRDVDLDAAISCLENKVSRGVDGLKEDFPGRVPIGQLLGPPVLDNTMKSGNYLAVVPSTCRLIRIRKNMLKQCAYALTKSLLFHTPSVKNGKLGGSGSDIPTGIIAPLPRRVWCYFETLEEISMIVDEHVLQDFPENAYVVAPDAWKAIKLCGRSYGFEETGVVYAMSALEPRLPVLNVSTFSTNVSLVPIETIEEALSTLSNSLGLSYLLEQE